MSEPRVLTRRDGCVCFLQLHRPAQFNALDSELVEECRAALASWEGSAKVVVIEGDAETFCLGADFGEIDAGVARRGGDGTPPVSLFEVLLSLAEGPYITIAHVRGRANAAGVGLAAACDLVIAAETAQFSLSEMLFGLYPAYVLPFLVRRIGFQRSHYMTLSTLPIGIDQAAQWGLVDAYAADSTALLQQHLRRVRRLPARAITHYKSYAKQLEGIAQEVKSAALQANREMFSDPSNLRAIHHFVQHRVLPREGLE